MATRRGGTRSVSALAIVAAASVVLFALGCGRNETTASEQATPGFTDRQSEVSDQPFELFDPTTADGPTTIPGPGPTLFLPSGVERPTTSIVGVEPFQSTTTTTTSTTTTTTTTLPLVITRPATNDRICLGFYGVADVIRRGQRQVTEQNWTDTVVFDRYRADWISAIGAGRRELQGAPPGPEGSLASALSRRLDLSATVAQTVTSFSGAQLMLGAISVSPPAPGEPVGWLEIEAHLLRVCPSVIRELTGKDTIN